MLYVAFETPIVVFDTVEARIFSEKTIMTESEGEIVVALSIGSVESIVGRVVSVGSVGPPPHWHSIKSIDNNKR